MPSTIPLPAISIVIAAATPAACLRGALDSVLAQSFPDWEALVMVAPGQEAAGLPAAPDPRLSVLRHRGTGTAAARNAAMPVARGEALLFLDAEDRLAPDALARLAGALEEAPVAVGAAGPFAFVAADPAPDALPPHPHMPPEGDLLERLCIGNLFANGGQLLLRREAVLRAGGFATQLPYGEDWEYWARLALQGPYTATAEAEPVLLVRRVPGRACFGTCDPALLGPALEAIFGNPLLAERLDPVRREALRRRAEAESAWIAGRELLRHGEREEGLRHLRASVAAAPSARRAMLLAAAHALTVLPSALRGPFAPAASRCS